MRILWTNPSFSDYRVPFYKALNEFFKGQFYLVYSEERISERCKNKIDKSLGSNALCLRKEKVFNFGNVRNGFSNRSISIPYPKGLTKMLSSINADVFISEGFFQWTPWALKQALRLKAPFLIAYEKTKHTERRCPAWRTFYRKVINNFVDGYLVNGNLCTQYLSDTLNVTNKNIIEGVMAADSTMLSKKVSSIKKNYSILERKENRLNNGLTYLYVGRLIKLKGIDFLINAWNKHIVSYPMDKLILVGDGPERSTLESMSHDSIHFLGNIDYEQIHFYYAKADIFVMPSLEDNWSLVVPEAMACSLPIACSCYNGCFPELVKENINGKIFDPMDINNTIEILSNFHYANLIEMGKQSHLIVKEYSPEKCALRAYEGIKNIAEKYYQRYK